ncbi:MAG: WYL domain-containing protein [Paraburkholderia sp.]|uniref:helix-turn-helix transcriptional regulator n=1 Tax=Paraburkholderia sp. TaxID=1926495 RepID=UPI0011FBCB68|nr:transcriptional regulator [Paraburkholderia sp.]TAL98655.1 MAG: WYL domain-containing protein [Paraburkholderia sp.]
MSTASSQRKTPKNPSQAVPAVKKSRVSKVSIERINKIVSLIRNRGAVSMPFLKKELEVSEASVKRDIDFLRDRLNCPLEWDRSKNGYAIHDHLAPGGRFELPGMWFEASEVVALLTMLHLVEGVQPGLLEDHVAPLKTRLRSMLSAGTRSVKPIEKKVKLIHFAPRKVEPKHFQLIAGALLEGKRLHLQYWNRDRRERTTRDISPLRLVHYRENWVLDAWCHERNALRTFSLEAIEEVRVLDENVLEVGDDALREHFESGYGIFAGPARYRARLKFTPSRAQWVSKEQWHPDQYSATLDDGSYLLEVPYSNDQELLMDLLRHAPEVEVLEPPELRERLYSALCNAAEKNRPA